MVELFFNSPRTEFHFYHQPAAHKYPLSSSLEDLLTRTNQVNEKKQLAALMKTASKTSIDRLQKKTSASDVNGFIDEHTKTQSMCRKSPAIRKGSLVAIAPASRSQDNLDAVRRDTGSVRSKKRVNILTSIEHPSSKQNLCSSTVSIDHDRANSAEGSAGTNTLNTRGCRSPDRYLTMTGTVKRGKKKGQSIDVQLNISQDELEKINSVALKIQQDHGAASQSCCACSISSGVHILLMSMLALPFVVMITGIYAFYMGTITWYNMFVYFSEEKSCFHRLFMSPILIVAYPVAIVLCTIGLSIYSGFVQLSTKFAKWSNEISDIEKGFYGWLCNFLRLSDCSPYEVIILTDIKAPNDIHPVQPMTEEQSL